MTAVGEAYFTASVPLTSSLGIGVRPVPEPLPEKYLNVRLTNGQFFYSAGFSGSSTFTTVDQGVPNVLSQAWPVKPTDGTGVFGQLGYPTHVLLASGGQAVSVVDHGPGPALRVSVSSGSLTGLLVGGRHVGTDDPLPVSGSVRTLSGSQTAILYGGLPAGQANPFWITGSVISATSGTQSVTTLSGSVVGILQGGTPVGLSNPLYVTGTVRVDNHPTSTTTLSGSVVGLLVGGQAASQGNPVPVTGSVSLASAPRVRLYDDVHDKSLQFGAFGILKAAPEQVLADYRFNTASIAADWSVATATGGGWMIEGGGTGVRLTTTASPGSKVTFQSAQSTVYQSGRGLMVKQSIVLGDSGVVGNVREWGYYSPTGTSGSNGAVVQLSGSTLQWVVTANGSGTVMPASSWDVPVAVDPYGHIWYQQFEWLGVGNIYLYYDERLVHTYRFIGTSLSFSLGTPDLPVWYRNENIAAGSSAYMKAGCASVVSEGGPSAIRVGDSITALDSAQLGKSVITGKTTAGGGAYVDVKVSPAGAVQVGGTVDQGAGGASAWLVTGSVKTINESGYIWVSPGTYQAVQRAFTGSTGAALSNQIVPAQGAGVKIRVLEWQVSYNSFITLYSGFYSDTTQISANLPYQGVVTYQWQNFTEHGHFETLPNQALKFNFTGGAGAPWGVNVLWIPVT